MEQPHSNNLNPDHDKVDGYPSYDDDDNDDHSQDGRESSSYGQESISSRTFNSSQLEGMDDDIGADIGFIDYGSSVYSEPPESSLMRRPTFDKIERSPEATLKRDVKPSYCNPELMRLRSNTESSVKMKLKELKSPELPGVHFSLYFDEAKHALIVHINQAIHLPTNRPIESSNPFIQVYLLPTKREIQVSHAIKRTHNPVFDCVFKFSKLTLDVLKRQMLVMRLYLNNLSHFIGGVVYEMEEANVHGEKIVVRVSEFDEDESQKVSRS